MSNVNIISRRITALHKLYDKQDGIFIEDVRKEFRADLMQFIVGKTLAMRDGKLLIGKNLYKDWL
jgi:hypothetical protein